ncbi:MAG TPA: BON domain-containing protein [Usitatibacter sp.]|nr:BON domain-containing protein [Usitatibacter sp.]
MRTGFPRAALAVALCAVALAACDREDMQRADRAGAQAGRKADEAMAKTKGALSEAGHRAGQAFSEMGKRIDAATAPGKPRDATAADRRSEAAPQDSGPQDTGKQARAALSDAAITASIKTDILKDPDLSVLKIDVDTRGGVVTLNGLAENEAARERAAKIAEATKGVREVRNHLVVKQA